MIGQNILFIAAAFLLASCSHNSGGHPAASGGYEKELSFPGAGGVTLRGSLAAFGKCERPVLFLVGSGKEDRDETTAAHYTHSGKEERPFRQISDALVREGFCTFRYDKRGVLSSARNVDPEIWKTADRQNLIGDAVAAARLLLKLSDRDSKDLLILGHSEGTIIAVETALELGSTKGLLLLGAQARSMKEMLHYQVVESRLRQSSGQGPAGTREEEYKKAIKMIAESAQELAPDGKPMAWYRQHMSAPANAIRARAVRGPIAIFQGEADPQTPIDEVARFLKQRPDVTAYRYPGLGHSFSPDKDGQPTMGPIQENVLRDIAAHAKKLYRLP